MLSWDQLLNIFIEKETNKSNANGDKKSGT